MKFLKYLIFLIFLLTTAYLILDYIQEPVRLNKEVRSEAKGKFIRLSKGIVHYQLLGKKNDPLVILVGGGGLGLEVWDKNIKALVENNYRVLRYDHFGRGYSDRVKEDYSLGLFYEQFRELLDTLNLQQEPFYLVGLSMGAMISIKYTNQFSEKVKKLVLIDPAGIYPFKASLPLKVPIISDLLMTFYWRPRAIKKQLEEFYEPGNFDQYKELLIKQIRIKGYKDAQLSLWKHTLSIDLSKEIRSIGNKRTMLIWGKQDPRTLFEASDFYRSALKNLKFLPVDKAGHLSNYERPKTVNDELIKFLQD